MKKIVTTINQHYSAGQKPVFQTNNHSDQWVWHDSIAYYFSGKQDITCQSSITTGDWKSVDKSRGSKPVQGELVTISIGHTNSNAYTYMICPGIGYTDAPAMTTKLQIRIISNTVAVQAVESYFTTMAVCYKSATFQIHGSKPLTVSQPCLILSTTRNNKAI